MVKCSLLWHFIIGINIALKSMEERDHDHDNHDRIDVPNANYLGINNI